MKNYLLVILSIFLFSCDDVIEEDISKKGVSIISPPDQFNPGNTTVNFFWDYLKGAEEYQLEVVKGRFDSVISFVLDTFVVSNQYTYNFNPGKYEWSLRALNSISSTPYIVRSFTIDSSSNISQSIVLLKFPLTPDKNIYADSSLTLLWDEIFSATHYIVSVSDRSTENVVFLDTTNTTSISTGKILTTKEYNWKVRALNAQSQTVFTESNFEIDLNSPSAPTLRSPSDQDVIALGATVNLDWDSGVDAEGNWAYDSLYLYPGSLNNAPIRHILTVSNYSDSTLAAGSYFWRVISFDKSENGGVLSTDREFTIQ